MEKNMGSWDKAIRITIAVGIALAWAFGYISGILATLLLILATIFLGTSMVGVCPLYKPFKFSTLKQ